MKSLFEGKFEFSFSDFKDYWVCPLRFALNYKAKKEGSRPRARNSRKFLEGWCVHKCLEIWNSQGHWQPGWMSDVFIDVQFTRYGNAKFLAEGQDPPNANLAQVVLTEFLRKNNVLWRAGEDEASALDSIKQGLRQLDYWIPILGMNHERMESERFFILTIPQLNILAKGSIDLIDHRFPDIYDMKYSNAGYVDWKQLLWYDFALTALLGKKVRKVYTFNPLNPEPLEYQENSEDELAAFFEELEGVVKEIRTGEFEATPSRQECGMCVVASNCSHCVVKAS